MKRIALLPEGTVSHEAIKYLLEIRPMNYFLQTYRGRISGSRQGSGRL